MNASSKINPAPSQAIQRRNEMLTVIAMKHLDLQSLDFKIPTVATCPIPAIKAALEASYEAGANAMLAALSSK